MGAKEGAFKIYFGINQVNLFTLKLFKNYKHLLLCFLSPEYPPHSFYIFGCKVNQIRDKPSKAPDTI